MATAVISVASGKGGVGKTTSVANLSVAMGRQGLNVLAWDMDGQGNLAQAFGVELSAIRWSSYHLMSGRLDTLEPAIQRTNFHGVSLVAAHMELFAAEQELLGSVGKEYIVRTLLQQPAAQNFDVIMIDLPPNLGFHTVNGFAASRWVMIPLQVSGFALSGLRQLAHAIRLAQEHLNPELELMGLLPTFVSARTNFSRELVEALHLLPATRVFQPYIPYTVRVAEGSLTGVPVVATGVANPAATAYMEVAAHMWELVRAAPEHVTRAPSPTIAPPPRAQLQAVNDVPTGTRPRVIPGAPERRRGLFGWFRRGEESPS
ncbi:MAG TPA: ParA family protein [Candidatus Dormibacteraeota bacterium]|nr:ParA family protein [Candidatus Dormibacteraeota bacterium]